ncbi:MAG: ATP-NAD kinase family protein [Chloroflexota bacterium]
MSRARVRLGLIVNPMAGLGGRVGLKGSDGEIVQQRAIALGAQPRAGERAREALTALLPLKDDIEIVTYPGSMGAEAAESLGFRVQVIGRIEAGGTSAQDTRRAARSMADMGVVLILFAGGDGTARDIYDAVGLSVPVLGIPAGVKIHSPVYAIHPRAASELAARLVRGERLAFHEAEVIDLDEDAYRCGKVATRLYGYLKVPSAGQFVQNAKSASPASEQEAAREIAAFVVAQMQPGVAYIVGPGTTTRAIAACLGLDKTLLGVDVLRDRALLARDVNEGQLLDILTQYPDRKIIVTPIGGQGYLFGRGNQQISPQVVRAVGRENILVVGTVNKIVALRGRPLLVDTGEAEVDRSLQGYVKVITGHNQSMVYRVG